MKYRVTIDVKPLAAVAEFAAVQDIRYYLKGVFVDVAGGFLVATDGHAMGVARNATGWEDDRIDFSIPLDVAKEIVKAAKPVKAAHVTLMSEDGKSWAVDGAIRVAPFKAVDGSFPNWRRVYPTEFSGVAASLDPNITIKCVKARKALGKGSDVSGQFETKANGMSACLAILDANVHAVIMPLLEAAKIVPFESFL